jgi:hypothetical protein
MTGVIYGCYRNVEKNGGFGSDVASWRSPQRSVNNWLLGERCGRVGKLWILKHGQRPLRLLSADGETSGKSHSGCIAIPVASVEFRASGLFFVERQDLISYL